MKNIFIILFALFSVNVCAEEKNLSQTTKNILLQITKENVVEYEFNPSYQRIIDVLNTYNNSFITTRFNISTPISYEVNSKMFCGVADIPEKVFRNLALMSDEYYTNLFNTYSNIKPEYRSCFCLYNVDMYSNLSDGCILARREAHDADIGYFDYKKHLQEYLPGITKEKFKKLAEKQSMVDSYRIENCIDNYELTSFERKECINYTHIFMEKLIYNTLKPCEKEYVENKNSKHEEMIKAWLDGYPELIPKEKLIRERYKKQDIVRFEIENNCSLE